MTIIKRITLRFQWLLPARALEAASVKSQEQESRDQKIFRAAMVASDPSGPDWLEELEGMMDRSGEVANYGPGIARQLAPPFTRQTAQQWPFPLNANDRQLLKALKIGVR